MNTLDQPLYIGLSVSAEGADTNLVLSFAGVETTELFSTLSLNTYDTQLKIGGGFSGFVSDLKITRAKKTSSYFASQYSTSNCPEYCPSMCRSDNSCDFLCDDGYLQDTGCMTFLDFNVFRY